MSLWLSSCFRFRKGLYYQNRTQEHFAPQFGPRYRYGVAGVLSAMIRVYC